MWGVGFIAFLHCLMGKRPFRCKQAFPREKKFILDSCGLSFTMIYAPIYSTACDVINARRMF
jgi:hypothetical protein